MSRKNRIVLIGISYYHLLVIVVWVASCVFALSRSGVTSGSFGAIAKDLNIPSEFPDTWFEPEPCMTCGKPGTVAALIDVPGGHRADWYCDKCSSTYKD